MEAATLRKPDSINLLLHATPEGLTRQSTITPAWLARGRSIVIEGLPGRQAPHRSTVRRCSLLTKRRAVYVRAPVAYRLQSIQRLRQEPSNARSIDPHNEERGANRYLGELPG